MRPAKLDEMKNVVTRYFGKDAGNSVGVLKAPPGTKPEECGDLHVLRCNDVEGRMKWTESVWFPTFRERLMILIGRPLWLGVWAGGWTQPPVVIHMAESWGPEKK